MINPKLFKIGTAVVVVLLCAMIAFGLRSNSAKPPKKSASKTIGTLNWEPKTSSQLDDASADSGDGSSEDTDDRQLASRKAKDLTLRVGVIGSVPRRTEITGLPRLPVTDKELRNYFKRSKDQTCRLLMPRTPIQEPHSSVESERVGTLGRVPALTIGLELAAEGRDKLPTPTRIEVERYFANHRLSVQPVLHHDVDGQLYFGTQTHAAFFRLDQLAETVRPEPMIETAVSRFRCLGLLGNPSQETNPNARLDPTLGQSPDRALPANGEAVTEVDNNQVTPQPKVDFGRTLAMAFQFQREHSLDEESAVSPSSDEKESTELLLLHIPLSATADNPELRVFVTSGDRSTLHQIDARGTELNAALPSMVASVRFDKLILMGVYPAKPVVTSLRFRSERIFPVKTISYLTEQGRPSERLTVSEILDEFDSLETEQVENMDDQTDVWISDLARQKRDAISRMKEESQRDPRELHLPSIPLSTGLAQ